MTTIAPAADLAAPAAGRRSTRTRRRFLILSLVALAVLATALGVSFTANTGTATLTATASSSTSSLVYTADYGTASTLPSSAGTVKWLKGNGSTPTAPTFSTISAGTPATVDTQGDVAIVDATDTTSSNVLVTVYVTNMNGMASDYSSWALPVRVYADTTTGSPATFSAWSGTAYTGTADTYLTSTSGYETFTLPTGAGVYYEITLDAGGSLYPYSTSDTADLAPTFYITAQGGA